MKRSLIIVGVVLLAALTAVACISFFFDANVVRPQVESRLQSALGRSVHVGSLSLSLLSGGLSASDITIADDPAFSRGPFVRARQVNVGVELWPLITRREANISSLTLVNPEVTLLQAGDGRWNFSTLGSNAKKGGGSAAPGSARISSLKVEDGRVSVGRAGGKLSAYTNVNVKASNIGPDSQFPFSMSLTTPGGGKATIEGHAGPVNATDSALTPLNAEIKISSLDLGSTGLLGPESAVSGVMDYTGTLASSDGTARSEGTIRAQRLRLTKAGSPASAPITIDYAATHNLQRSTGTLSRGNIHIGKSISHLTGNYDLRNEPAVVHMVMTGQDLPVPDLVGVLPAFGVTLPSGASLQGGTATANLRFDGAVDRMLTSGAVQIANTKVTNFSMAKELALVAALAGIQKTADTTIQMMSSDLQISPGGTQAQNLNIVIPELGAVTGSGVIASNNTLDFRMVAKLNTAAGSVAGGLANLAGLAGKGSNTLPFRIQGTTARPIFVPDVAGMVKGGGLLQPLGSGGTQSGQTSNRSPNQQNSVGDLIHGLLGNKKKK
ncbi:MAG TPA: AsmA family protein [Terriglobales bacterium]|nr:AsmA family protein [Terriglobales bacterium]